MDSGKLALRLLTDDDWVGAVCDSNDAAAIREVLLRCAQMMLPYWEARFTRDESMAAVVDMMQRVVAVPTEENRTALKSAIPKRVRRHWDLSPPPGMCPDPINSNCPADFAGDSIFYCASAVSSGDASDLDDTRSALENAVESIARLLAERNTDDDNGTDYCRTASGFVKERIAAGIRDARA